MRLAWAAVVASACIGLAIVACTSFASDDTADTSGLDGATEGSDQADAAPIDGGPGIDACVGKDLAKDPAHCGSCGHDCLGGECADGGCMAKRLAVADNNVEGVAVTDGGVYWVTGGSTVFSCPLDGCTDAGILASGLSGVNAIVSVGNNLAVLADTGVHVVTADGATKRVPGGYNSMKSLASDGDTTIYFVAYENSLKVWRFDTAGDGGAQSVRDDNALTEVAVAGSHVFYHSVNGTELVGVCDRPSCANPRNLVTGTAPTGSEALLAPTNDALFWIRIVDDRLLTCAVGGCDTPTTLLSTSELTSIATDEKFVYFSTGGGRTVERCPQTGCGGTNRVVLAKGPQPRNFVVAGKALYWATDNDPPMLPAIWRIAR